MSAKVKHNGQEQCRARAVVWVDSGQNISFLLGCLDTVWDAEDRIIIKNCWAEGSKVYIFEKLFTLTIQKYQNQC